MNKNVPAIERIVRIVLGLAAMAGGVMLQGRPGWIVLIATGVILVATGIVGWCPVCRLAGRKPQ